MKDFALQILDADSVTTMQVAGCCAYCECPIEDGPVAYGGFFLHAECLERMNSELAMDEVPDEEAEEA